MVGFSHGASNIFFGRRCGIIIAPWFFLFSDSDRFLFCYAFPMEKKVKIIGGGLAGCECALQLASRGISVTLVEMRPEESTGVHKTAFLAELVCSNSLKGRNPETAAGMLKEELAALGSVLYRVAMSNEVAAGGALAVDRDAFARRVTELVCTHPSLCLERREAWDIAAEAKDFDALVVATGPLTSDALAQSLQRATGLEHLAFFDAAAPIVMADSLDESILFRQSRYEEGLGDYLNAPFTKEEYERFIDELLHAERVVKKEFETKDLFQACQPVEEIARTGKDAPRFGALKPVGLTDPRTGRRPWAAVQLRAENAQGSCYNLVGFQTNLTFPEQQRVFRMIPGLERAEFARFGVMHRNTFVDAPKVLNADLELMGASEQMGIPVLLAGQVSGTEGYVEAIRSGLHAAFTIISRFRDVEPPQVPVHTVFGALLRYATDSNTIEYQPSHVNFGMLEPLEHPIRNKKARYAAYAKRGNAALEGYRKALVATGVLRDEVEVSFEQVSSCAATER